MMRERALVLVTICLFQSSTVSALTGFGLGGVPLAELILDDEPLREGTTPPDVIFERVISLPGDGVNETDLIVLRNVGGQTADLTDWTLVDSDAKPEETLTFGGEGCEFLASLPPAAKLELRPRTSDNPCGFEFRINFLDGLTLFNEAGERVADIAWQDSVEGTSFRILASGEYGQVPEDLNVIETLEELGDFEVLLRVLDTLNLTDDLVAATSPNYEGVEVETVPEAPIAVQFPSHFGFSINRTEELLMAPPAPKPRKPKEGIPRRGPYTILAPTDAAFDDFRAQLAGTGNRPVTEEFMLELPEMVDIMLYHVIGGQWSSEFLLNNTPIFTAKGVEVVPFVDGLMTEGSIQLHDACIDKPTPDNFECIEQAEFNKCFDPFMTNPLGADWQGGFCERSCGRCTCDPRRGAPCAEIELVDVMASNGVIHAVSRVLFPPPRFEKEALAPTAETILTGSAARTREGAAGTGTTDERPVLGIGVGFSVRDTEADAEDETVQGLETATEEAAPAGRGGGGGGRQRRGF